MQVNVEAKENKELAKKYNVTALPTMAFIGRDGKELRRVQGAVPPDALIKEARIATGEELSFEQLYEQYKKKKNNFDIQQQLLLEGPMFIATQEGYDRQKWGTRKMCIRDRYFSTSKK